MSARGKPESTPWEAQVLLLNKSMQGSEKCLDCGHVLLVLQTDAAQIGKHTDFEPAPIQAMVVDSVCLC